MQAAGEPPIFVENPFLKARAEASQASETAIVERRLPFPEAAPAAITVTPARISAGTSLSFCQKLIKLLKNICAGFIGVLGSLILACLVSGSLAGHDFIVGGLLVGFGVAAILAGILVPLAIGFVYAVARQCCASDAQSRADAGAASARCGDQLYNAFIGVREWGVNRFLEGLYGNQYSKTYTNMPFSGTLKGGLVQSISLFAQIFISLIYGAYLACKSSDHPEAEEFFLDRVARIIGESAFVLIGILRNASEVEETNFTPVTLEPTSAAEIERNALSAVMSSAAASAEAGEGGNVRFRGTVTSDQVDEAYNSLSREERQHLSM